jgi:hypothetical protein
VHALLLLLLPSAEAQVDAGLAARATGGAVQGFSKAMTLRRLHWRNSLLGELLYTINVAKVRGERLVHAVRCAATCSRLILPSRILKHIVQAAVCRMHG